MQNFHMYSKKIVGKIDFNNQVHVNPTLSKRSRGISYEDAKESFTNANIVRDCTFDPRSRREYHFNIDAAFGNSDTLEFYNNFSRNNHKIHLIARTDNRTGNLSEKPQGSKTDNKTPYQNIQTEQLPPFFGRYSDPEFEEVCIDTTYVETNKTTDSALETAIAYEQASILEITDSHSLSKKIEHLNKKSPAWNSFAKSAGWRGF